MIICIDNESTISTFLFGKYLQERTDDCEEYKKVILHSIEMAKEGNQVHTAVFVKICFKKI